jgi:glutaredoxin
VRVRIYTKARCPLCDEARAVLADLASRVSFTLEEVDIRSSGTAWARFRYQVPVVEVDGEVVSTLRVNAATLEKRVRGTPVA